LLDYPTIIGIFSTNQSFGDIKNMTKKTTDLPKSKEDPKQAAGIVLELEFMLFPGRQLTYKAFSSALKTSQVTLEQAAFSRYCLPRSIEKSLPGLLAAVGKKGMATETLAAKIKKQFESALNDSSCQPVPELMALLKKASDNNIKIGLLSFLPEENARQLMERAALNQTACLHVMKKEADDLPTPDSWLSLLKSMNITPRCAIALVDGATACKSALAVGMCCGVIPDCFTAWQEFTGADFVAENAADLKLNEISALFSTAHFRKRVK
jgi:beta-phosphoglucomutase-like phosphatase (HAD superfamily)